MPEAKVVMWGLDVTMVGCKTLAQPAMVTDGIAGINDKLMDVDSVGDKAGIDKGTVMTTGGVGSTSYKAL